METSVSRLSSTAGRALAQRPPFKRPAPARYAMLQARGTVQCPSIRSISRSGIKLDGAFGLQAGDVVTVKLPTQHALNGTVEWSVAGFCGILFAEPLSADDAVLLDA